jgi:beta-lactamase class A
MTRGSCAVCVAFLVSAAIATLTAQTPAELTPLAASNAAIEGRLEGGGAHSYGLRTTGNQFLDLAVEQKGVDAVVSVFSPTGERLLTMDSPNGTVGFENVRMVLAVRGTYRVEVRALTFFDAPGAYAISVRTLREATNEDRTQTAVAPGTPLGQLRRRIEQTITSVNASWGIYIKCLETGDEIALNADTPMDTMSVIKVPLMVEAFRLAEEGRLSLDERVTLTEADRNPGTGVLFMLDPGSSLTVRDLLRLMIVVSDNTATDVIYKRVGGPPAVTALMRNYGLMTITARNTAAEWFRAFSMAPDMWQFHLKGDTVLGMASARDMGRLLEKILRGEVVSKQASAAMMQMMLQQVYTSRIPRFIQGQVGIAHKTGDFLPYIGNDVGVLFLPGRQVVLSVFTGRHNGDPAVLEEAIGRIAEDVYRFYLQ